MFFCYEIQASVLNYVGGKGVGVGGGGGGGDVVKGSIGILLECVLQ